jgi:hypothetical protein
MTDPDRITRTEAARLLGCSTSTVIRMESSGELKPVGCTPRGVREHSRKAVLAVRERWIAEGDRKPSPTPTVPTLAVTPEQARAAFVAFREGRTLPEIVEETGLLPEQVRALYAEWKTPLEAPAPAANASPRRSSAEEEAREIRAYEARMRDLDEADRARRRAQEESDREHSRRVAAIEDARRELDRQRNERAFQRRQDSLSPRRDDRSPR